MSQKTLQNARFLYATTRASSRDESRERILRPPTSQVVTQNGFRRILLQRRDERGGSDRRRPCWLCVRQAACRNPIRYHHHRHQRQGNIEPHIVLTHSWLTDMGCRSTWTLTLGRLGGSYSQNRPPNAASLWCAHIPTLSPNFPSCS